MYCTIMKKMPPLLQKAKDALGELRYRDAALYARMHIEHGEQLIGEDEMFVFEEPFKQRVDSLRIWRKNLTCTTLMEEEKGYTEAYRGFIESEIKNISSVVLVITFLPQ